MGVTALCPSEHKKPEQTERLRAWIYSILNVFCLLRLYEWLILSVSPASRMRHGGPLRSVATEVLTYLRYFYNFQCFRVD